MADSPQRSSGTGVMHSETVVRRLSLGLLPYLVLCNCLRQLWLYRIHKFYSWTRDILAAIAGTGIVPPIFGKLSDALAGKPGSSESLKAGLLGLPDWLLVIGVLAFLTLSALKVLVSHYETAKKTVLTDNCCKEFSIIRAHLDSLLQSKNPLPGLIDYQNRVAVTVDRLIQEDCWPFQAPFDSIRSDVERLVKHYSDSYSRYWTDVSET